MKSLGVIETRGFVAAIQVVDAACKCAEVNCIGYRKVGSGRVSVCFEGEISAIRTAIERGVAVLMAVGQQACSLVIARPELSVTDALSRLKGYPPYAEVKVNAPVEVEADGIVPTSPEINASIESVSLPASDRTEEKYKAMKRGKKA
ncbi:BMC domain-containing protein [Pantoea sp. Bo_2]|uniref:BMC domain-containing protein n=1 Tax=Candidatus Pantoea gossypiicola TaxID=2608008 RepID=A0AB34CIE1_9GAMM|nr:MULTISPECIES: BMC domain-containing protein [Pantoea]KAA5931033.1 BMC domain-containing protein [Pantoea sp. VH_8]KAA5935700.1 BMC domain-containing protein [Pantoea sp. VH_4]KAA5948818.1 BMC domain-containing protein [Pantoea sp. VH_3]KAA5955201.1 BMC domain-containing protein [Pantoea sp. VH_25]KAA5957667.1 BMC domain-containing protein [Pantoea sp. VH_24]